MRLVVFDCDGVMFDTTKVNTAYYNQILNHFGLPDMTEEMRTYVQAHTVYESIAAIFGDDALAIKKANAFRQQMSYTPFLKQMEIEPYLKPLLKRLRPRYKTAVATNRTDTMRRVLKAFELEDDFDLVVCALDVEHPKPHPQILNKVLDHFDCVPAEAVYIGDTSLDQAAARAAGVHFIAYGNRSLSADLHIQSLKEIERFLRQFESARSKG